MGKGSKWRGVLMAGISIGSLAACAPAPEPVKHTAKVCDPKTDATCHPTAHTKVVVR